jgi:hypothetical protein
MKALIISVGLILLFGSAALGDGRADDKANLIALEKQSWVAWQNHDGKFFEKFLSDDHVEVGFGGPTDKATVVAGVAGPDCTVTSYSVDKFKVTMFNAETALVTYFADQDTICGGQKVPRPVWVSSLYLKRAGHWENALYQQSQAPGP